MELDEWIKKTQHIFTMEYYSAIKKNESVPFAGKWIELEVLVLSEINQTQKSKYYMLSVTCGD
jgi:hypothetical protein